MATPEPWRGLAAAILLQAHKDAQAGDPLDAGEAYAWLAGPHARWLVGLLDLDGGGLAHVLATIPPPRQPILPGLL